MPRTLNIALPAVKTPETVAELENIKGLISIRLQEGISLKPPGDVISLEVTNRTIPQVMELLDKKGMLDDRAVSVTTAHPLSVLSNSSSRKISTDRSETIWEETLSTINKQSAMTVNNLINMFLSGIIGVTGLTTNTIHLLIGASILAPGFGAVTRISFGLITRHYTWKNGVKDTVKGYSVLILGAIVSSLLMQITGTEIIGGSSSYLEAGTLITYFTGITFPGLLVSAAASLTGALLILSNRSILTAGVMIALSLVPSACITGMSLCAGDFAMAAKAFGRLILEIMIIASFTGVVYLIKRRTEHKRNTKL